MVEEMLVVMVGKIVAVQEMEEEIVEEMVGR